MLDPYTALRTRGLVDLSARPDSPVRTGRRARPALKTREGLAAGLHRLARVLEPRPSTERNRPTAAPACQ